MKVKVICKIIHRHYDLWNDLIRKKISTKYTIKYIEIFAYEIVKERTECFDMKPCDLMWCVQRYTEIFVSGHER